MPAPTFVRLPFPGRAPAKVVDAPLLPMVRATAASTGIAEGERAGRSLQTGDRGAGERAEIERSSAAGVEGAHRQGRRICQGQNAAAEERHTAVVIAGSKRGQRRSRQTSNRR